MSDASHSKTGLTAWQRWELPTFDMPAPAAEIIEVLPTADQLTQIHQQAHDEGYQAGYQEGLQAGRQLADQEAQRLAQLADALEHDLQNVDQAIADDLLKLSVEIAQQVLQHALRVKPELLIPVVQQAINTLPPFNQHASLRMHPDDAALLRERMGEQLAHSGWKIFEDAQVERGGCLVETASSQIDATLESRWKRVIATLGQDTSWLES